MKRKSRLCFFSMNVPGSAELELGTYFQTRWCYFFRDTMDNLRICLWVCLARGDYSFEGEELSLLGSSGYILSLFSFSLSPRSVFFLIPSVYLPEQFFLSGYMFAVVYYHDMNCNTSPTPSSCPFFFRGVSYI